MNKLQKYMIPAIITLLTASGITFAATVTSWDVVPGDGDVVFTPGWFDTLVKKINTLQPKVNGTCGAGEGIVAVSPTDGKITCAPLPTATGATSTGTCTTNSGCTGTLPDNALPTALLSSSGADWNYDGDKVGNCTFRCNTHYTWGGGKCNPDIQPATCTGSIPADSVAVTSTNYSVAWDGTKFAKELSWSSDAAQKDVAGNVACVYTGVVAGDALCGEYNGKALSVKPNPATDLAKLCGNASQLLDSSILGPDQGDWAWTCVSSLGKPEEKRVNCGATPDYMLFAWQGSGHSGIEMTWKREGYPNSSAGIPFALFGLSLRNGYDLSKNNQWCEYINKDSPKNPTHFDVLPSPSRPAPQPGVTWKINRQQFFDTYYNGNTRWYWSTIYAIGSIISGADDIRPQQYGCGNISSGDHNPHYEAADVMYDKFVEQKVVSAPGCTGSLPANSSARSVSPNQKGAWHFDDGTDCSYMCDTSWKGDLCDVPDPVDRYTICNQDTGNYVGCRTQFDPDNINWIDPSEPCVQVSCDTTQGFCNPPVNDNDFCTSGKGGIGMM